jgi:hypothetical protein
MAMRDPGTPGRNPLLGSDPGAGESPGGGPADPPPWGPDGDALGAVVHLFDALTQAQPEATEHLVAAAHEVVLAVKTVVDAAEAALAQQRAAMAEARRAPSHSPVPGPDASRPEPPSGVHRIDIG